MTNLLPNDNFRSDWSADHLIQAAYLLDDVPLIVVEWGTWQIQSCNEAIERVFGYGSQELIGWTTEALHADEDSFKHFGRQSESVMGRGSEGFYSLIQMRRKDGSLFPAEVLVHKITDHEGEPMATLNAVRDLTALDQDGEFFDMAVRPEAYVLHSDIPGTVFRRLRLPDGTDRYTFIGGQLLTQHGLNARDVKRDAEEVLGRIESYYREQYEQALLESERTLESIDMEVRFGAPDGDRLWLRVLSQPKRWADGSTSWHGLAMDITREREAEAKAHWLATHDRLTGLINHDAFMAQLEGDLERAFETGARIAVVHVRVRRMLHINESFGSDTGDELLRQMAARIQQALRPEDIVARSHGNVFLAMLSSAESTQKLSETLKAIRATVDEPFSVKSGLSIDAGMYIGVACFPDDDDSADSLIRAAALAAKEARARPEVPFEFYSQELSESSRKEQKLEASLRTAITQEDLEPYYQPQLSLSDGTLIGFEALVRWPQQDGSSISPGHFIPIAERSGLIQDLGILMLRKVAQDIQEWAAHRSSVPPISVNCSARQFQNSDFINLFQEHIIDQGIDAKSLVLELTEETVVENFSEAQNMMEALEELGVSFSIDDFGVGFSSLKTLSELPFGCLKVDKSFVTNIETDQHRRAIVEALTRMGQTLGMYVIAEGVETQKHERILKEMGCDGAQGFYFGHPVHANEVPDIMDRMPRHFED